MTTTKYTLTKFLCPVKKVGKEEWNKYSIFVKLDDKITASGLTNFEPFEDDIIECVLKEIK